MSGHVTYSCACLNIKLHLSNEYLLEQHDENLLKTFVRIDEPPLEGWEFQLGMGGVQAEYNALMRVRALDGSWMTVECLNCSTGAVYSVQRRPLKVNVTYPVDIQDLYRPGDRILIHKNTHYGPELEKIKKQSSYSKRFNIVLNQDATHVSEQDEEKVPGDLYMSHTHLNRILDASLKQMKVETDARIERFRAEQLRELESTSAKIKYDRQALWHRILEASRAVHDDEINEQAFNTRKAPSASSSHVRFDENRENSNLAKNPKLQESEMATFSSNSPIRSNQQQQKLFIKPSSLRPQASFGLDEHHLSASLRQQQQHPSSPLATAAVVEPDDNDEDKVDEEVDQRNPMTDDDDDNGMFELDEDIEADDTEGDMKGKGKHETTEQKQQSWAKRRTSSKYISAFDDDIDEDQQQEEDNQDALSTSVSAFATSMPIAISYDQKPRSFISVNESAVDPADRGQTSNAENSNSNVNNTKYNTPSLTKSQVNFGQFSFADQEASLLFPAQRRRSIAVPRAGSRPQLDSISLIGRSLDTRNIRPQAKEEDDDDDGGGPMVPPHVLAARTFTDETEELFGAVPRSNTWRMTFE